MATNSLQTLIIIPILSSIALLLTLANTFQSAGKGTSFAYDFSGKKPTDLTYQGDAHFPTDTAVLRLTKTDPYGNPLIFSTGRAVYAKPVTFSTNNKQASFQTTIEFIITPRKGDKHPAADGLVFFIAPVNSAVGAAGGSFGVFDTWGNKSSVFAVEFDAYPNFYDPVSYPHVGIDIQSRDSIRFVEVGDDLVWENVTAVIDYNAITKVITVSGTAGERGFETLYVYDLSSLLPPQVEVGISAATGGFVAVHDVFSWSFHSDIVNVE